MTTRTPPQILSFILRQLLILTFLQPCLRRSMLAAAAGGGGKWEMLQPSIGITAMHMQLQYNDRVVIFDRTDFGPSNISLPKGECRRDPNEEVVKVDCTAHSVEFDVALNSFRPLEVLTDVWCSSGAVMPDGTLYQTGGFNDGDRVVRAYTPCSTDSCDWRENPLGLAARRWYATNHVLPGARQIIVGGRREFNYEFYPKTASTNREFDFPFLRQTNDRGSENNLYPLVFLNTDGNLFIFANNRAILFDYTRGAVVRTYPMLPDGNPRSYPSTGSGVLLPLNLEGQLHAEVLVCGGAPKGAFANVRRGVFVGALNTCGRITITAQNPQWAMETMPLARVMGDMLILPNGDILIINGAANGTAGWENSCNPVLSPVIYKPNAAPGARFEVQNPADRPRLYHSTAILLRDGRVLVGGSNPHVGYVFQDVLFPTDLSLESFSPPYLDPGFNAIRPRIVAPVSQTRITYGQDLIVKFQVSGALRANLVSVTMYSPSFTTHSISMNQRLLVLGGVTRIKCLGKSTYLTVVKAPTTANLAPSGYYILYVVHQDIPSVGSWVQLL